jgi:abortive infection bacteriophage resistance protein
MPWASFERVIRLYVFDRELRLICLDAIERIEVAIRCQISHEYSLLYGNNWYEDPKLYINEGLYVKTIKKVHEEINRTGEVFIRHYKTKYTSPINPPSWMTIEVLSFGQISKLYKNLISNETKKKVAHYFGVDFTILESWMENLSYIRNLCAHHSRLWNRTLTVKPKIPNHTNYQWIQNEISRKDKLYPSICVMAYMLERCSSKSPFYGKLQSLFNRFHEVNLSPAGFDKKWDKDPFWQNIHIPITHRIRIAVFKSAKIIRLN